VLRVRARARGRGRVMVRVKVRVRVRVRVRLVGRPHFPELVHLGVLARHEDQREEEDLVVRGRAEGYRLG